jgi:hypothetical protein
MLKRKFRGVVKQLFQEKKELQMKVLGWKKKI